MNKLIDDFIKTKVNEILVQKKTPENVDIIQTDNLGEVIEKLVILHIRTWMLEDACGLAKTDAELADLKRKIDICFKQKRPKLVEAINRLVSNSIQTQSSLVEDSVKIYTGH